MVRYNLDLVCHSSRQDAWVAAQQMNPRTQSHCLGKAASNRYADAVSRSVEAFGLADRRKVKFVRSRKRFVTS